MITGRFPAGLYHFVARFTRLTSLKNAYAGLLRDPYPSFSGSDDPSYPVRMQFAGPLPRYSRLKTFFQDEYARSAGVESRPVPGAGF